MSITEIPSEREPAPHPEGVSPWAPARRERDDAVIGPITLGLFSVFALIAALFSIVLYATDDDGGGSAAAGDTKTFDIQLGDLFVKPGAITVSAGDRVVLNVRNGGQVQHDLLLEGTTGTRMLNPGESDRADLGAITGPAKAWCSIPGHKEAGMVLDIRVQGATAAAPSGPTTGSVTNAATIDPNAKPGPSWHAFDPTLQPAPAGTVHDVKLSATESVIEVAPGVTQELWTFNGQYPGPTLRGKVGDVFNVTLTNDGKVGHSIDFHASKTPMDVDMRTLAPGESLVYQFKADYAGVWMYHCGTAPVLHHIGNGMFGTVIIDPPNLAPVDHEYLFVQSELYLGPEGKPGDLTKMQGEDFDAVVFNGYTSQYVHEPIQVGPATGSVRISSTPARPRTAPSTSSGRSSTPCTRKARICCGPAAPTAVARRLSTSSRRRVASSSSRSTRSASTPSSPTSSPTPARAPSASSRPGHRRQAAWRRTDIAAVAHSSCSDGNAPDRHGVEGSGPTEGVTRHEHARGTAAPDLRRRRRGSGGRAARGRADMG
jgi:nitrite reductase (NO-forming)